jgi:hypothetical protein
MPNNVAQDVEKKSVPEEYFGQISHARVPKDFTMLTKSFRQNLDPQQSIELGNYLIAAGQHAQRYAHQQKKNVGIRTKIEPINQIIVTTHNTGQITVLGRQSNSRK